MSLTFKEINYDNLDDLKKLESALKNWFTNPKELNFTDPSMQYPFDMKKWININYKLNKIETIALCNDDWIIGFGGVKFFEKSILSSDPYSIISLISSLSSRHGESRLKP